MWYYKVPYTLSFQGYGTFYALGRGEVNADLWSIEEFADNRLGQFLKVGNN